MFGAGLVAIPAPVARPAPELAQRASHPVPTARALHPPLAHLLVMTRHRGLLLSARERLELLRRHRSPPFVQSQSYPAAVQPSPSRSEKVTAPTRPRR